MVGAMVDRLHEVRRILGSKRAALKLLVHNEGLAVDGLALARELPGYPGTFRTKRNRKNLAVVGQAFVDTETADHPFVPTEIALSIDGRTSVVKVNYRAASPFRLVLGPDGLRVGLVGSDLAVEAALLQRPATSRQLIDGRPVDDYVQVIGRDRLGVLAYTGCENVFHRNQCRFCDSCAGRPGEPDAKPSLNDLEGRFGRDVKAWWDAVGPPFVSGLRQAYAATLADETIGPHRHVALMAGNLMDIDAEWRLALEIAAAMSSVRPLDSVDASINLLPPPDPRWLDRARAVGFGSAVFNLEVFGARAFRAVCPGKNKLLPYETYLERMQQAVEVFGAGHVHCGFVFGAQPAEDVMVGARWLAARGIVADYSSFTPKSGTPWADRPRPDVIETARFVAFLASLHREHGWRPLGCALSMRSSVLHETLDEHAGYS